MSSIPTSSSSTPRRVRIASPPSPPIPSPSSRQTASAHNFTSIPELSRLVTEPFMYDQVNGALDERSTSLIHLNHFCYITDTISRLEEELERQRTEHRNVYGHLTNDAYFRAKFRPLIDDFRKRTKPKTIKKPYTRPPARYRSPPPFIPSSSSSSDNTSSSSKYDTAEELSYPPFGLPGSSTNPILVDAPTRVVCRRCGQVGHRKIDCDTPMRSFTHCHTCHWRNRPQ
jgi:hypothetical protein